MPANAFMGNLKSEESSGLDDRVLEIGAAAGRGVRGVLKARQGVADRLAPHAGQTARSIRVRWNRRSIHVAACIRGPMALLGRCAESARSLRAISRLVVALRGAMSP